MHINQSFYNNYTQIINESNICKKCGKSENLDVLYNGFYIELINLFIKE